METTMKTWEMPKLNLKGTNRQIKWATDIVANIYTTANDNVKRAHDMQWSHADKWEEAFAQIIRQLEGFLEKTREAAVIISCRERFDSQRVLNLANKYVNLR